MQTNEQAGAPAHQVTAADAPDAPTVVFLHGAGWAGVSWFRQVDALRGHYRSVTIDLPGHGSSHPLRWSTLDGVADQVADVLRSLPQPAPAALVGFSLGADVGIRLLARHPDLLDSALLTGAVSHPVSRLERALDRLTWPLAALPLTHWVMTRTMRLPADLRREHWRTSRPLRVRDYARLSTQILGGAPLTGLAGVQVPVLVLAGGRESRDARRSARETAQALPDGLWAVVPGARHPWHVCEADRFNTVLKQWLAAPGTLPPALTDAEHGPATTCVPPAGLEPAT